MGGSPSVPSVPNYQTVAQQQQQANTSSALQSQSGSMVNQSNAYGNLGYTQTGTDQYGNPTYSASMTYNPTTEALFNQAQATAGGIGTLSPYYSAQGISTLGQAAPNFAQAGQAANQSNALINAGMGTIGSGNYGSSQSVAGQTGALTGQLMQSDINSMAPFFQMQTGQLQTSLQNRGIMPGTEAYNNAMLQNNQSQGLTVQSALANLEPQAYQQAANAYQLPATVGEGMISAGLGTGQLGQGYSSAGYGANASGASLYGASTTGLSALQSMTPQLNSTMTNTPGLNIQPASYTAAAANQSQAQLAAYSAQMQHLNAIYQAIGGAAQAGGGMGAAAIMAA